MSEERVVMVRSIVRSYADDTLLQIQAADGQTYVIRPAPKSEVNLNDMLILRRNGHVWEVVEDV